MSYKTEPVLFNQVIKKRLSFNYTVVFLHELLNIQS